MADYTNPHAYRRPRATIAESVVLNAPGAASEDKGHSYERALLQSQTAAARRRRQPGLGASTMLGQSTAGAADSVYQRGMARTAVLGDSTGSVRSPPTPTQQKLPPEISTAKPIRAEDVTPDDGVGSGLGDSYVDGTGLASPGPEQSQREEEELEDGGVLGLLAQIYGTKGQAQGPARVI
jgi:autophagy-related protein 9